MNEPQPATLRTYVLSNTAYMIDLGKKMLGMAEQNRRTGLQTFKSGPLEGEHPSADWAAAGMLIGRAMHHLDESIPNGQRDRTAAALGALVLGAELLEAALGRREVFPARLIVGSQPQQEVPPQPMDNPSPVFGRVRQSYDDLRAAAEAIAARSTAAAGGALNSAGDATGDVLGGPANGPV